MAGDSWKVVAIALLLPLAAATAEESQAASSEGAADPAAWGDDHVGEPIPDYVTGDECLFCHRGDVGPSWQSNPHQRTLRGVEPESQAFVELQANAALEPLLAETTVQMGSAGVVRFLKPNGRYGQLAIFSHGWVEAQRGAAAAQAEPPAWDEERFGLRCAGCHATAVDAAARRFSSPALDCYACHGAVDISHTADTSRMIFAKGRRDEPRVVLSICASCHVRSGRSRSSGLPYANNFVAGDNLFRDFEVDLSAAVLASHDPSDRHVLENVRAVVVEGREGVTCLTCHSVHGESSTRHEGLRPQASCYTCHVDNEPLDELRSWVDRSELCEY